jgi:poly-gamma-glutamate capsule biosynthesis protein CapA/YwtB (metallophosphatase superfamily)
MFENLYEGWKLANVRRWIQGLHFTVLNSRATMRYILYPISCILILLKDSVRLHRLYLIACYTISLILAFQTVATPSDDPGFTFIAVGDVMLSRGVGVQIQQHGPTFPFEPTAEILRNADLTFINLETQISTLGAPMKNKEVHFRADAESVLGLVHAGIDVVSLSNNHSMDFGDAALFETMDILAHHGIAYVGAGMNEASARRSANFIRNGVKISVLAYSWNFYLTVEATAEQPGVAVVQRDKTDETPAVILSQRLKMAEDIVRAKRWADVVIVSFHWGWEYANRPTKTDRETARCAIDAGATLVVGHHPHVIQGVEWYGGKLICYSLGNFVFDLQRPRTRRGLILRCHFDTNGNIQFAELLPIAIHSEEFRPRIASGEHGFAIITEVQRLSAPMKTKLRLHATGAMFMLRTHPRQDDD